MAGSQSTLVLVGRCKDFGFCSEWKGQYLDGLEHSRDMT